MLSTIKDVSLALGAGCAVGALFGFLKLPIPAPPTLAGLAGIIGVFLGFVLVTRG